MKLKTLLIIIVTPFVLIAVYYMFPWVAIFLGINLGKNPSPLKITYGEFPFKLIYEIRGEQKVVEDVLICKYDGIGWNEGQGKFRKWKSCLASATERISLFVTEEGQEIYYDPGPAWYYMGDLDGTDYSHSFPNASFIVKDGEFTVRGAIKEKELFEQYGIKLISWQPSPPLDNKFVFK